MFDQNYVLALQISSGYFSFLLLLHLSLLRLTRVLVQAKSRTAPCCPFVRRPLMCHTPHVIACTSCAGVLMVLPGAGWGCTQRLSHGLRHTQVHYALPLHHFARTRTSPLQLQLQLLPHSPPTPFLSRLEPQLMIIGQSAGVAVAQALRNGRQV